MIDVTTLSKKERDFVVEVINRIDNGDVKRLGSELLADFVGGLSPEVFQQGYRLGDVVCQSDDAEAFNLALASEHKSCLHMICVGFALAQQRKR